MQRMDSYLDDAIGDNFRLLTDLLRSLKNKEKDLYGQVYYNYPNYS